MSAKYEDLKVKMQARETPESHQLLVHIPQGFQRHNIGAKVEFDFGRVRVHGELPLQNNVIKRFNQVYQVPETCDINKITGKFEERIVTITMRKKEISEVPDQTLKTVQEPEPEPEEYKNQEEKSQLGEPDSEDKEENQQGKEGLSKQDSKSTIDKNAETETPSQQEDKGKSTPEIDQEGAVTQEALSNEEVQRDEKSTGKSDEKEKKPRDEETFEQEKIAVVDESLSIVSKNRKRKASFDLATYIPESTAKRMATIIEDKQKVIYMGAAVAMVALGVYVSYKLRSSARH